MAYYLEGWFSFQRTRPFPTFYDELKTPVTVDVLEVGWIVAFCTIAASAYVIIPGQPKGAKIFLRVTVALFIGLVIMICNFGHEWEVGQLDTHTPYRAGTGEEINATIHMKLGLRAVNITLKADTTTNEVLKDETINYNERFSWAWEQGRFGFGPMAGRIQQEFRYHQRRGTPLPILWIAEYFTFDGEGLRFGRHYRLAGWYAHICLWAALPTWLLSLILLNMVISYGAIMVTITGALMTSAAIIWSHVRNSIEMEIVFSPPEDILRTKFGYHFYLALIVGILCMIYGITVFILDFLYHDAVCAWFGINPLAYEEYEIVDIDSGNENTAMEGSDDIEMATMSSPTLAQKAKGFKKSIAVRLRSRGTSNRNWKIQHVSKTDNLFPPPPPPILILPTETYQQEDSEPSYYTYTSTPSQAPSQAPSQPPSHAPPPRPVKNF